MALQATLRPINPSVAGSTTVADAATSVSTAVLKVFDIVELFEHILTQLPDLRDVVTCQRVCREWRARIEASKPLRRVLFCGASLSSRTRTTRASAQASNLRERKRGAPKLNPLLPHFLYDNPPEHIETSKLGFHLSGRISTIRANFPITSGSWAQMYISDPPPAAIKVCIEVSASWYSYPFRYEKQILAARLGELRNLVVETMRATAEAMRKRGWHDWKMSAWQTCFLKLEVEV